MFSPASVGVLAAITLAVAAPARESLPLPQWEFAAEATPHQRPPDAADWQPVTVPHVFRQSGLPDNAAGWYRRPLTITPADQSRRLYLRLEGAASVKDVFVDGRPVGGHRGAFSAAVFDLTPELKATGPHEIAVRVSNRDEEAVGCFSRSNLYYVNGGMFRPASLLKTAAVHIAPEHGASGVFLTPQNITPEGADLATRTVVRNPLATPADVIVRHTVTAPDGKVCAAFSAAQTIPAGGTASLAATGRIARPKLWDLGTPHLYRVRTELLVNGKSVDALTERTGFRTIAFRDGRFLLNGRPVQFLGVNKHEQTEHAWNAVDPAESRREYQLMADLGINTVRLAHYPHSPLEYDLADEQGLAVWAENGFAGQIWKQAPESEKIPTADGERLTREMVLQLWNHPGILFWSAGNETIVPTVEHYADIIRAADTTRLVTYAANAKEPQNCDFVARNTYAGWYGGTLAGFGKREGNALISETGAGNWLTHHVPYADAFHWKVNHFEPAEYAEMFTEFRLQTVCRDDAAHRPMFLWWIFRDFYDLKFKNRLNTKGLVGFGGVPKDPYYLFQAFLRPDKPVVRLTGRHHFLRGFAPDNGIKAYSNAPELELFLNGRSQGRRRNGDYRLPDSPDKNADGTPRSPGIAVANVFLWKAPLRPGRNVVEVRDARGNADRMIIHQKSPDGSVPADPAALVRDLKSSNPRNPAVWIDRPAESQGPVHTDVDGSSDNTFDRLPARLAGAGWIATRRLGDPALQTDLSFRIDPDATVFVLFSAGTFPLVTLKNPDAAIQSESAAFEKSLAAAGFRDTGEALHWRDHDLDLADARLWSLRVKAGETVTLPGRSLDYVVLVARAPKP